jgi:hypothetical protein
MREGSVRGARGAKMCVKICCICNFARYLQSRFGSGDVPLILINTTGLYILAFLKRLHGYSGARRLSLAPFEHPISLAIGRANKLRLGRDVRMEENRNIKVEERAEAKK